MAMMKFVPCLLIVSIGSGAAVSAQSLVPTANTVQSDRAAGAADASTNLVDSARKRADQLVAREAAWGRASRTHAHAPGDGQAVAFAVGATVGGLVGFGIAGSQCHCESGKAALIGAAVGGVGGVLLFRALTK